MEESHTRQMEDMKKMIEQMMQYHEDHKIGIN